MVTTTASRLLERNSSMPSDHQEPTLGLVRELGLEFHLLISILCGALYSVISHDEDKRIMAP